MVLNFKCSSIETTSHLKFDNPTLKRESRRVRHDQLHSEILKIVVISTKSCTNWADFFSKMAHLSPTQLSRTHLLRPTPFSIEDILHSKPSNNISPVNSEHLVQHRHGSSGHRETTNLTESSYSFTSFPDLSAVTRRTSSDLCACSQVSCYCKSRALEHLQQPYLVPTPGKFSHCSLVFLPLFLCCWQNLTKFRFFTLWNKVNQIINNYNLKKFSCLNSSIHE